MHAFIKNLYKNPSEALAADNILVHTADLEHDTAAFVYRSRKGFYHIVVNESLNIETRTRVFLHEIAHIKTDMPKAGYVLGLDMQREKIEYQADLIAREIAAGYTRKIIRS